MRPDGVGDENQVRGRVWRIEEEGTQTPGQRKRKCVTLLYVLARQDPRDLSDERSTVSSVSSANGCENPCPKDAEGSLIVN